MNQSLSDESLRKIAKRKVRFRYSVKLHVFLFLIVNLGLLCINAVFTPNFLWAVIVLFAWLTGIVLHGLTYILYAKGVYPMAKRATIIIIISYIFVMLLLLVINVLTLGTVNWALFPLLFGGAGVLIYLIIYLIFFRSKMSDDGQKRSIIDRAVDKEIEKISKKRNSTSQ